MNQKSQSRHKNGNKIILIPTKRKSIPTKIKISLSILPFVSNPKADEDNFININKIGITTGNPKIAIKVALLLDFEAMAEINVNVIENPILPRKIANQNCCKS